MTNLQTILKDLSQLLPERFRVEIDDDSLDCAGFSVYVDGNWFWLVGMDVRPRVHIQCACQEEIEARDWRVSMYRYPESEWKHNITIAQHPWHIRVVRLQDYDQDGYAFYGEAFADTPALAIATALLDALKAEQAT